MGVSDQTVLLACIMESCVQGVLFYGIWLGIARDEGTKDANIETVVYNHVYRCHSALVDR